MNNLLTKTLFISLLSSAVIPSNVQANLSGVAKKIFQVTTGTGVLSGAAAGGIATLIAITPIDMKIKSINASITVSILETLALEKGTLAQGALVGAVVGGLVEVAKTKIQQYRKKDNL